MKVQQISQQQSISSKNKQPSFGSAIDLTMRYLATNQAVGANSVDLASMVAPRTINDSVRRGPLAGIETFRREIMGTVNDSLLGGYGMAAGALIAALMGIQGKFGVSANKILAAPETVNILAENKTHQIKGNESQYEYLRNIFKDIKVFNPSSENADIEGFVKLSDETVDKVSKTMDKVISDTTIDYSKWNSKKSADSIHVVKNMIIGEVGGESKVILTSLDGKHTSETKLATLLEDTFNLSKAFNKKNVMKAFEEQINSNKSIFENRFIKNFAKFGKVKSLAGFAIASAVGLSVQPINMYLTKKKTGTDGFVGVEGRTKDNSKTFLGLKLASTAGFLGMVMSTLNPEINGLKKVLPHNFMKKMAFKGFWPTVNQLKGVYGITIISRLMSSRDKDELRESLTKDFCGYLSWLVLGDIVNRLVAEKLNNSVMNRTKAVENKGFWSRAFNSTLKTRDEILVETLAKNGISTNKEVDGKTIAKTFKEMMQDLNGIKNEAVKKAAKKRLSTLNKAQFAGYAFSCIVLGLGIPNLNIYITNKLDKKHKAEINKQKENSQDNLKTA